MLMTVIFSTHPRTNLIIEGVRFGEIRNVEGEIAKFFFKICCTIENHRVTLGFNYNALKDKSFFFLYHIAITKHYTA